MRYFLAGLLLGTLALAAILARRFRVGWEPAEELAIWSDPYVLSRLDEGLRQLDAGRRVEWRLLDTEPLWERVP